MRVCAWEGCVCAYGCNFFCKCVRDKGACACAATISCAGVQLGCSIHVRRECRLQKQASVGVSSLCPVGLGNRLSL